MITTDRLIKSLVAQKIARDEATVRSLLGEWQSGLEPAIAYDANFKIMGLTIADMPLGSDAHIVVPNPDYRPRRVWPDGLLWVDGEGYV